MSITRLRDESTPTTATTEKIKRFGRYTLIQKIGHGGMATLYLARLDGPVGFEKFFAIKKIHPHLAEEREFVTMFLDEARIASQIQHPNVVQIFELGEAEGDFFFAMEYLEGESLASIMKEIAHRNKPPPRPLIAHIIAQTAAGLHAAHELRGPDGESLGLVHRDVSPHNVLVTYDGQVKLLDFGIAKASGRLSQTATGELKGKYAYMAPEQLRGGQTVDRRSDIFSLGVVLFEATTLQRLFKAETELLTLERAQRCQVPRPTALDRYFPGNLEAIVLRALQKDRNDRYQTAAEFAADLEAYVASTEVPANTATLGAWMGELFHAEAERKRGMLEVARRLPVQPEPDAAKAGRSGGVAKWLAITSAAVGLALLLTATIWFVLGGEEREQAGSIRVMSTPAGGEVFLDNRPAAGRTPLTIEGVLLGHHTLTVTLRDHDAEQTSVVLREPSKTVAVSVTLERSTPMPGTLEVAAAGLQVFIDDGAEARGTPLRAELAPGPHKVVISGPAGTRIEQQLTIVAGQKTVITPPASLVAPGDSRTDAVDAGPPPPRQPAKSFGYLNLNTAPWAVVYLGGRKLGTTPLVKAKLPAGRRRLKLLPEGRTPAKHVTVHIKAGQTVRKTARF